MERQIMLMFRNGTMFRGKYGVDKSLSMAISDTLASAVLDGRDLEKIKFIKPEIIGDSSEENILNNVRERL